eukprot:CAMPEP_0116091284 /NCGR_PEP_ID=MMETSP0327-20121206/7423_1 /TAXON_ID=44447 /ORGANISM="Pseudo-nitzschia delicatissima, Strain B596" /LENGTH=646 /DNA_ID=CAMNT_0003582625 /DNA_START=72 /DNA_END=2012 /DNA_ORIENTATION=-
MREEGSHVDQESNDRGRTTSFPLSQDEEEDDTLMVCRCETPKILYDLLQSFSKHGSWSKGGTSGSYGSRLTAGTQTEEATLHKLHPMTVFCTKSGLTIHSQSSNKQFQASMELPASLFGHYRLMEDENNDDDVSYDFTIHWQTFMQCLNLLMIGTGGDKAPSGNTAASFFRTHHTPAPQHSLSSLTLSYHTSTEVLRLEWEGGSNSGGNVVATAAIPGLNPPPADEAAELSAAFGQSPIAARWLCPQAGHELSDTKELDYLPGATTVRLRFLRAYEDAGAQEEHLGSRLRLSAKGHSGKVSIEIPAPIEFSGENDENDNRNATKRHKIAHTYSLASWKRALQPLDMARETCLSVNTRGILAIQHQLVVDVSGRSHRSKNKRRSSYGSDTHSQQPPQPPTSNESAFCDFLLLPLEVDEDRNDDDESDDNVGSDQEEYSANDDDRTLTPQQSTQGSLSQATRDTNNNNYNVDEDDEEDEIRPSTARGKRRRRILSSTQDTDATLGNDDEATNASVRLPIGSDDEDDENPNDAEGAPSRMNLLFPIVTDGNRNDARSSSNHHNRRWSREHRKRQRQSHQPTSSSTMSAQRGGTGGDAEDDNESQERSVNLLDDDEEGDQNQGNGGSLYSDVDDDDRYCSSPELVYGEQG